MSSDLRGPERIRSAARARRTERQTRRFRRTVAATLVVLGVAAVGTGVVGALQAPQVRAGSVDVVAATERTDQRIVLRFDQPIAEVAAGDVSITPEVPITASVDGTVLTLRLGAPLDHAVDYTVSADVVGTATGRAGAGEYRFTTPSATIATLVRDPDGDDRVERRVLGAAESEVVFAAPRIQEYALLPAATAAILLASDDTTTVVLDDGEVRADIPIPDEGRAGDLRSSGRSGLFAFTVTGRTIGADGELEYLQTLLLYDPLDGSGIPRTLPGLDGDPLQVQDYLFVPDTTSLIAKSLDAGLLLVDTTGANPPVPLGEHDELRGFLPGTTSLVVADATAVSAIDLATGDTEIVDLPDGGLPADTYESGLEVIGDGAYVEIVSRAASAATPFDLRFAAIVVDDAGTGVLYDATETAATVRHLCLSDNGQYVAVAVSEDGAEFDGYPDAASFSGMTTYVVRIADGELVGSVRGDASDWCA